MIKNLQRMVVALATMMICLGASAIDEVAKTTVMTGELTSVEALESADAFLLQNEAGDLIYIPTGWDMKTASPAEAVKGEAYCYKCISETNGTLVQVLTKDLQPRSIGWLAATEPYGTTTFINRQPAGQNVVFGLGLNNKFGQDGDNLALWTITYDSEKGFAFENVGVKGSYLSSANGAACPSEEIVYWRAYTGFEEVNAEEPETPEQPETPEEPETPTYTVPEGSVDLATLTGTNANWATTVNYPMSFAVQGAAFGDGDGSNESTHVNVADYEKLTLVVSKKSATAEGLALRVWLWDDENNQVVTLFAYPESEYETVADWKAEHRITGEGNYVVNLSGLKYLKGIKAANNWGAEPLEVALAYVTPKAGEVEEPEEPETPAQLIADGTYYIYNTEAQAYLSNGAFWGTRSVLADQGIAYGVSCNVENGKYTLKSGIKGDKALRPSDGFNDQSGEWEIKETEGGFALFNGEKYFSHVEGSMIPGYTDDITAGSVWTFVTAESRKALLSDATAENPVDATVYIQAPDFLNGDIANAAWEGNKVGGDAGSGNTLINNTNCEKWNAGSFTVSQTITDIPNGIYKLTAQAYYRHGGPAVAAGAFEAGEEVLPTLYANDNKVTIKSIFSEAKEAAEGGWAVASGAYFIPNSQAQAAACFETGAYINTIEEIEVTDNTLTIGVTREGEQVEDWTVFDTFRLTYYGEKKETPEEPEQPETPEQPEIAGTTLILSPGGNSNLPVPEDAVRVFSFTNQWSSTSPTVNSFDAAIYKDVKVEFEEALEYYFNTPYKDATGEQKWGGVAVGATEFSLDLTTIGSITEFNIQNVTEGATTGFAIKSATATKLDGTVENLVFQAPGWGGSMNVDATITSAVATFNGQWANIGIKGIEGVEGKKLIRFYANSPINVDAIQYCVKTADGADAWPQLTLVNDTYAETVIDETLSSLLLQWRIEQAGSVDIAAITYEILPSEEPAVKPEFVYVIGDINDRGWDPSSDEIKLVYNEEADNYTGTIEVRNNWEGFGWVGFSTALSEDKDNWDAFNAARISVTADWGTIGEAGTIVIGQDASFKLAEGSYNVTISLANSTILIESNVVDGIASVDAAAKANGKYIENGKVVIVKNGVKYNVAGARIK